MRACDAGRGGRPARREWACRFRSGSAIYCEQGGSQVSVRCCSAAIVDTSTRQMLRDSDRDPRRAPYSAGRGRRRRRRCARIASPISNEFASSTRRLRVTDPSMSGYRSLRWISPGRAGAHGAHARRGLQRPWIQVRCPVRRRPTPTPPCRIPRRFPRAPHDDGPLPATEETRSAPQRPVQSEPSALSRKALEGG